MNIDEAQEISSIVNSLNRYTLKVRSLQKGYKDEYEIHYNGAKVMDLDLDIYNIIIDYYCKKVKECQDKINSYKS